MRRLFILSWIGSLLAGHTARALDAPQLLLGPGSRAVVVGMLSWKDKVLAAFDAQGRKDRELAEALSERAGLARGAVTLLLDGAATRAALLKAIGAAASATRPGATLVIYYAGHGVRTTANEAAYAPVDVDLSRVAETGLTMSELTRALSPLPARYAGASATTATGTSTTSGWGTTASARPRAADVTRSRRTSGSGRGRPAVEWPGRGRRRTGRTRARRVASGCPFP
jgi:hypothetical protein